MKNYYQILGIGTNADAIEIRKKYRELALKYHPDKNPNDPRAEDKFKEVAEAYGVLIDPIKKKHYDQALSAQKHQSKTNPHFSYSQEDILKDVFENDQFNQIFNDIFQDFKKAGIRADNKFFDRVFFGGRGFFFGGFFMFTPLQQKRSSQLNSDHKPFLDQDSRHLFSNNLAQQIRDKMAKLLYFQKDVQAIARNDHKFGRDLVYQLPISKADAQTGTWLTIAIQRGKGQENIKVKIPNNTRSGTRLRIPEKGMIGKKGSGSLYLQIMVE